MAHREISDSTYPNTASGIKIYIKNAASDGKNKRDRRAILRAYPYETYLGCSRKLHNFFLQFKEEGDVDEEEHLGQ